MSWNCNGSIWRLRCVACGAEETNRGLDLPPLPRCGQCGGLLRPGVVWFGESLDEAILQKALQAAQGCQVMLVIGTSAVVQPAASLSSVAKGAGAFCHRSEPGSHAQQRPGGCQPHGQGSRDHARLGGAPMTRPVITLTTDFGHGPFVGVMKGVILGICSEAALVDICHTIAPQDVRAGALSLEQAMTAFPPGTVHLCVVDPGVGTSRRAMGGAGPGHVFRGAR